MRFLSVKEAAKVLKVSAPRVYQFIAQGRLRARKAGAKEYVIRATDLKAVRHRSKGGRPRKRPGRPRKKVQREC